MSGVHKFMDNFETWLNESVEDERKENLIDFIKKTTVEKLQISVADLEMEAAKFISTFGIDNLRNFSECNLITIDGNSVQFNVRKNSGPMVQFN